MSNPTMQQHHNLPIRHCRSCGADVLWLTNEKTGKRAPITAKPVAEGGNIQVDFVWGTYTVVPKAKRTGPLRVNHFSECQQANRWHKDRTEVAS